MFEGWNQVGDAAMGLLPDRVGAPVNDVLGEMRYAAARLGYLERVTYRDAAQLHTQLVEPEMVTDVRMLDALTRCATRIATQLSISQMSGEGLRTNSPADAQNANATERRQAADDDPPPPF